MREDRHAVAGLDGLAAAGLFGGGAAVGGGGTFGGIPLLPKNSVVSYNDGRYTVQSSASNGTLELRSLGRDGHIVCGVPHDDASARESADGARECASCGNTLMPDALFCRKCGTPLGKCGMRRAACMRTCTAYILDPGHEYTHNYVHRP